MKKVYERPIMTVTSYEANSAIMLSAANTQIGGQANFKSKAYNVIF